MEIGKNPKNTRKNLTFNSLLAPKRMAQMEHRLFYPHRGFGSLGSAMPGRGGEQISNVTLTGIGSPGRVVPLPATSGVVLELLGEGRAFSIPKKSKIQRDQSKL